MVFLLWPLVAGASNDWKVVSQDGRTVWLDLPRVAVVEQEDASGKTWRQTGTMEVSVAVARNDFIKCMAKQGFTLRHGIPVGETRDRTEVLVFLSGQRQVLVMLSEDGPAHCTFSVGEKDMSGGK